jgi:hypothetical protein
MMATKLKKRPLRTKVRTLYRSLYIAVQPVGSRFAKALQSALRNKIINNVFRVSHQKGVAHEQKGRSLFKITSEPLDKIEQLQRFKDKGVSCPAFCTSPEGVRELGSKVVFARTLVNSTNGRGIVEFDLLPNVPPPRAPLYTAYIPKKAEYRVHVFNGQVVDTQQKRKKREFEGDRDTRVRNLANGYVYCRDGIVQSKSRDDLAVAAVGSLNYRYGAVDIIYNEKQDKYFVIEVNSRPGLMGTTLDKYADALINTFNLTKKPA